MKIKKLIIEYNYILLKYYHLTLLTKLTCISVLVNNASTIIVWPSLAAHINAEAPYYNNNNIVFNNIHMLHIIIRSKRSYLILMFKYVKGIDILNFHN
jgi:hypothetical protein